MNEGPNDASRPTGAAPETIDRGADDEIDLAQLWGVLWNGKWLIVASMAIALVLGGFYLFITPNTYRADALLQIQSKSSSPLQGVTSDLKQLAGSGDSEAKGEIPIIKSRTVLRDAAEELGLTISATPNYFPVIGRALAERSETGEPVTEPVEISSGGWLGHYAWEPVSIDVSRLVLPASLKGQPLTLTAIGGGAYVVFGPEGKRLMRGTVGKPAEARTRTGETVRLFVKDIHVSNPPTDFTVVRKDWLPVVEGLQGQLSISEQGEETGIVSIGLEGADRQRITSIINVVAQKYLRQNVEARSKEAEKSLAFLQDQLPELRNDLEAAETKLSQYREEQRSLDLNAEGQALLDQIVSIEEKRSQLKLKLAELKQTYTGDHPALESAREQMQSLADKREELKTQVGELPEEQKQILQLRRSVEVNTKLYTAMLNRAQELRVVKAGTVGNVRIVDEAVSPVRPVGPKSALTLVLALMLGAMLGVGIVMLRALLRRGISDPKEIESKLGMPVYTVVPFSNWQEKHSRRAWRRGGKAPLLARENGDDTTVEALRSLRTSLYFAQMGSSDSKTLVISGPTPKVGKSFVSVNLAYLLEEAGQRVVIVDADMRKGRLHDYTADGEREPGLSQVLTGQIDYKEAIRTIAETQTSVITSGRIPPNPSELLMRRAFSELIQQLQGEFDTVIIDAPPVLAVTDAAVIAAEVSESVTFMVARAGHNSLPELDEAISRFSRSARAPAGVVFNGYRAEHARYAGGYSYYQYEYKKGG